MNIYETDKLLGEYLLFHYGTADEVLPWAFGPREALGYPARCVTECLDIQTLPEGARGLDLGCAVGRSSFELARHCRDVLGIDYSQRFIEAATVLQRDGALDYERTDEGALTSRLTARVASDLDRDRVRFETGDAMNLRSGIGPFDVVLMANLIDRLDEPQRCLARLPELLNSGGQLIITSPYTWLEDFTPARNWLGGYGSGDHRVTTQEGLRRALGASFDLAATRNLPFLIREHARKFQWSVAEATIWRRR